MTKTTALIISLLFFTTACTSDLSAGQADRPVSQGPQPASSPVASPTAGAARSLSVLASAQQPAATEQLTAQPTTDTVATQIALVQALGTSQAETSALKDQLAQQNLAAHQVDLDIQKSKENQAANDATTAKYNAAISASDAAKAQSDADRARAISDKAAADAIITTQLTEQIKAQAAADQAKAGQVLAVCIVAIVIAGAIILLRVMSRQPSAQSAQPADEVIDDGPVFQPEARVGAAPQSSSTLPPLTRRTIPAGVLEQTLIKFACNVRTSSNKSGIPFTRDWWVGRNGMPRKEWDALIEFMTDLKYDYAMQVNPGAANSSLTFTPKGEQYLARFVEEVRTKGTSPSGPAIPNT